VISFFRGVSNMLSSSDQLAVQQLIDSSTEGELASLRQRAESSLAEANTISAVRLLSREESKAVNYAVEVLTRLDAKACGGGWWYRTKRRPQIVAMYLGG